MNKLWVLPVSVLLLFAGLTGCGRQVHVHGPDPRVTNTVLNQNTSLAQNDPSSGSHVPSQANDTNTTSPGGTSSVSGTQANVTETRGNQETSSTVGSSVAKAISAATSNPVVDAVLSKTSRTDKVNISLLNQNAKPINNEWIVQFSINGQTALVVKVNVTTDTVDSVQSLS